MNKITHPQITTLHTATPSHTNCQPENTKMVKYLVCVDGSENGDLAFHRATQLYVSHRDELVILLVHSGLEENREKETEVIHRYSKVQTKEEITT